MSISSYPAIRPQRLRRTAQLRALVAEHRVSLCDLIAPIFIKANIRDKQAISSMPGQFQYPLELVADYAASLFELGIKAVLLFGIPENKDEKGSDCLHDNGIVQQAISHIKSRVPSLLVIADCCFCEYTNHGHCGIIDEQGFLDNDASLNLLNQQAVSLAKAGADVIAPSGMLDGMVSSLRHALDEANFIHVSIMSYAVKYCSKLYGPFRDAAEGSPQFGDRAHYQMDPANTNEALLEAELDVNEGADFIMVKPGIAYLDIVAKLAEKFPATPLAVYQVSGEYAMIKAAAAQGAVDELAVVLECLTAFKRAGARLIISYYSEYLAKSGAL